MEYVFEPRIPWYVNVFLRVSDRLDLIVVKEAHPIGIGRKEDQLFYTQQIENAPDLGGELTTTVTFPPGAEGIMGDLPLGGVSDQDGGSHPARFERHGGKTDRNGRFIGLPIGIADGDIVSGGTANSVVFPALLRPVGMGRPERAGKKIGNLSPAVDQTVHLENVNSRSWFSYHRLKGIEIVFISFSPFP